MNLYTAVNDVLKRLDDYPSVSGESVWTRAEIEQYLKDGYNAFCRQTKCILDFFYPENIPTAGNYVGKWEESYFDSGMIAIGLLGFSGGYWEQDYAEAGRIGPINHTQPWEAEYLTTTFTVSRVKVADDNVAVDRATHDFHTLEPEFTRFFERTNKNFQTTSGEPWRYTMDRDGIGYMRVVPAGAGNATTVEISDPPKPLKAYWTMDETGGVRVDSVGGYHLSDPTSAGSVSGKIGNGATFVDTSSQYLQHPNAITLDGSLGITVETWLNVRSGAPTDSWYLYNGSQFVSAILLNTSNAGALYVFFGVENDLGETTSAGLLLAAYDTWYYIVGRYDPETSKPSISVDGGAWTEGLALALGHPMIDVGYGSGEVLVGGKTATNFSKSYIDEMAVWNMVVSDAEIAVHMALTRPAFGTDENGLYGLLRTAEDTDGFGTWAPVGTWGTLREIPEYFPMGAPYGIPRRLYSDDSNTRVEYFRLGKSLDEYQFEIPDRFVKYVEYYAQAKALERDGPGQDLALSGHFMQRFGDGVGRMTSRMAEMKRSRQGAIGGGSRVPTKLATARLPWRYGRATRRVY